MNDYRRVLGYAFRHRGKIAAIVLCASVGGVLYGGTIAGAMPVTQLAVSKDGLAGLLEETWVKERPWIKARVEDALPLLPDQTTAAGRYTTFVGLCAVIFCAMVVGGILRFLNDYLAGIVATTVVHDIRNELYEHVIQHDLAMFGEAGVAKIMTRFTVDPNHLDRGVRTLFGLMTREPVKAVTCLVLALSIDWQLTLLSLTAGPLVGIAIYRFGRAVKRYTRRVLGHFSLLNTILQETFLGVSIVKAFSMEPYETRRFRQRNARLRRNQIRMERADAATQPTTQLLAMAGVLMVAAIGVRRVVFGDMPMGAFVGLYALLIALYDPIRRLSRVNNRIQQCIAGARRVFELRDAEPAVREAPNASTLDRMSRGIALRDVHFRYTPEAAEALRGVHLEIQAGETVAIVGHSGAGKTSLINLIPRLYDPTEGALEIDGIDIRNVTFESLRRQIALVTQQVVLFEDTVANNIAYGHHECPREEIIAAAKAANAHDFITQLTDGYDTMIGERGENLSGGQRARLAIARAVLRDPTILILDEATANLDSESEVLIQDALNRLEKGRTTIVIAHRLSTVQHADRVVVLHEGRVESDGTHQQLLETSPIYRALHRIQFGAADGVDRSSEGA